MSYLKFTFAFLSILAFQESQASLSSELSVSPEIFEKILVGSHPDYFTGIEVYREDVVKQYRQQGMGLDELEQAGQHYPFLQPIIDDIEAFICYSGQFHNGLEVKRFQQEISCHKDLEDINGAWLLGLPFRYTALMSQGKISDEEKDVFSHAPYPGYFLSLLQNNGWRSHTQTYLNLDAHDHNGREIYNTPTLLFLSYATINALERRIEKEAPREIIYPLAGVSKYGLAFGVRALIDEVYLAGIHDKHESAHGVKLSSVSFSTHDLVHHELDQRRAGLLKHILLEADSFVGRGGSASDFFKEYVPVALNRYAMIKSVLKQIYDGLNVYVLPVCGEAEYRKCLVGFFYGLHEAPNFPPEILAENDLEKVLGILFELEVQQVGLMMESPLPLSQKLASWEHTYDPLETSPIDGSTSHSDADIINFVKTTYPVSAAVENTGQGFFSNQLMDPLQIERVEVNRSPRFIDAIFTMKSGEKLTYTFTTLYHKFLNANDNIGLLMYAGVEIDVPDLLSLQDIHEQRQAARLMLRDIEFKLDTLKSHFLDVSRYLLGSRTQSKFFRRYSKQTVKLTEKLGDSYKPGLGRKLPDYLQIK